MAEVSLQNVSKIYDNGVKAVSNATLSISDKEFVVFVGPSGCGKSTLLRMIAGLENLSGGDLYIGGELMNKVHPKDRDIAMVFQNYALYPHMSVYDNMAFGLKLRYMPTMQIEERVVSAADKLGLINYLERLPKTLSGGQRQRVALGRSIVRRPKVFLLDEPLSNLDAKFRALMRTEIIDIYKKLETNFIYVTHDQLEAMTMGTKIVIMRDGLIQQADPPQVVYDFPANVFVAQFIGLPPMNIMDAKLEKKDENKYFVVVGDSKFPLEESAVKRLGRNFKRSLDISLGVRAENIIPCPESEAIMTGDICLIENLGNEQYIYTDISGYENSLVFRVPPRKFFKRGNRQGIKFDTKRIHMFDKETGVTILEKWRSDGEDLD